MNTNSPLQNLKGVDTCRYDESWELRPSEVAARFFETSVTSPKAPSLSNSAPKTLTSEVESRNGTRRLAHGKVAVANSSGLPTPPAETFSSGRLNTLDITPRNDVVSLDFRTSSDFEGLSIPSSISLPLKSLTAEMESPFVSSEILREQWLELEALFSMSQDVSTAIVSDDYVCVKKREVVRNLRGKRVLCVDYTGETSRVATSLLRAKGIEAWSLKGSLSGFCNWSAWGTKLAADYQQGEFGRIPG